jgi:hypothetical protein
MRATPFRSCRAYQLRNPTGILKDQIVDRAPDRSRSFLLPLGESGSQCTLYRGKRTSTILDVPAEASL